MNVIGLGARRVRACARDPRDDRAQVSLSKVAGMRTGQGHTCTRLGQLVTPSYQQYVSGSSILLNENTFQTYLVESFLFSPLPS